MDRRLLIKRLDALESQARQLLEAIQGLRDDMPKDVSAPSAVTAKLIEQAERQLFRPGKRPGKKRAKR
ncbi:MAG: hypothetical protein EPO02_04075 [Nitrospirae bacterium]|nr:MAG: hypothetical protein EPO02_04075 [Nitrospirota bacterium]